jgi:hypothetical protein
VEEKCIKEWFTRGSNCLVYQERFSSMFMPFQLFSYIDPVSGVILLQLVIGGCIGGLAYFSGKIGRGLRFLNPFNKSESETVLQLETKSIPEEK